MSDRRPSVTFADDAKLVEMIDQAERRVLLLAPGVNEVVAGALARAWQRLSAGRVSVILDVDPEVCRLGFGTLAALEKLRQAAKEAGTMLHHQPGVRIGVLVCDERTLVFSPPPLLVEAGSTQPERPNAIELGGVPGEVARDLGLGPNPHTERVVGLDPVRPDQIDAVKRDLAAAPPAKFDLARRVRVFTTRFQFVELKMTGCYISRKRAAIPSSLVGLARTQEVERQFHAQFDLVQAGSLEVKRPDGTPITEKRLQQQRRRIEKDFLVILPGYGTVVLRANKETFQRAVAALRADVEAFSKGLKEQIQGLIDRSRAAVAEALLPAVERNPPAEYCKTHGPNPPREVLAGRLREDLAKAFGTAADLTEAMEVKTVFKDVAYESLVDPAFLEVARKAMPTVEWLHEEYDASRAAPDPYQRSYSGSKA